MTITWRAAFHTRVTSSLVERLGFRAQYWLLLVQKR